MIQGPHPSAAYFDSDRVAQFARAVLDALGAGAGFNIQVLLPMSFGQDTDSTTEVGDLGGFSEKILPPDNVRTDSEEAGPWSSWEVWNVIRTVCRYSSRLSVGKINRPYLAADFTDAFRDLTQIVRVTVPCSLAAMVYFAPGY